MPTGRLLSGYRQFREGFEDQLMLHAWLYDLCTGDLLAYDEESCVWGALALPEKTP